MTAERPIMRAIAELRKELRRIDQAIHLLETLAHEKPRRGRPPKLLSEMMASQVNARKRRNQTPRT